MSGRQGLPAAPARASRDQAPAASCPPSTIACALGRDLRLPTFTVVAAVLAVIAHGAAQRMAPDGRLTLAAVVVVAAVGVILCRRRRSFEAIAAGLGIAQALAHVVLCLDHLTVVGAAPEGHHHAPITGGVVQGVMTQLLPTPVMGLAHLLAAGVAAWWLARGENAVWSAVRAWWSAVTVLTAPQIVLAGPRRPAAGGVRAVALHDQSPGRRTRPRRGPPRGARALVA